MLKEAEVAAQAQKLLDANDNHRPTASSIANDHARTAVGLGSLDVAEFWAAVAARIEKPEVAPRTRSGPTATGLRAEYPNAEPWDVMSFKDFMSVTEIAERLGGTVKEVQRALKTLEKRGNLAVKGRSYRLG